MQCYTELTPPTAVTHSLALPFLSASANNLVIAKTSLLQIFSLKSVVTTIDDHATRNVPVSNQTQREDANGPDSSLPHSATAKGDRLHTTKLVLVAQFELAGTITSLARVKILRSKSGGEALLVALRDAKLSLVEWDPERYSISTISIHYYEREDILGSPWEPDSGSCVNYLSVDPSSRCAALKFGVRHLAIIPFHQIGDDLIMDDYDAELDGERPDRKQSIYKSAAEGGTDERTPYAASFVLSLLALDPSLSHPIHLSFLYEYRDPTFGILYSQGATSLGLLHERRDNLSFAVYTLDLEQRASTTLSSVSNLPYDLFAVVPLSRLVGGALLVGGNEMIHVDQSGKTNGVAVNDFAKQSTTFSMLDQSDLNMRLENCVVKQFGLENSDLLIILNTGELAILSFKIDGRSVSGLSIRRMKDTNGGNAIYAGASCASIVGRGRMFVGSEDSDPLVLGWSRKSDRLKRKPSRTQMNIDGDDDEVDVDEEEIDEDDDDLYAETKPEIKRQEQTSLLSNADAEEDYTFRVHDSMVNFGPMTDVAIRHSPATDTNPASNTQSSTALLVASGRGRAGGLTNFQRGVTITQVDQPKIQNAHGVWSICTKRSQEDGRGSAYDEYIIASVANDLGDEKSAVYSMRSYDGDIVELLETDLDADTGATIDAGTLNGGAKLVQVLQSELRSYDQDLGLAQIYPLTDEESDTGPTVMSASFADPYVLLIRDDSSAVILTADENGDLDEVSQSQAFKAGKWQSGSLYEDSNDILRLEYPEESEDEAGNVLMFLLNAKGGLQVYRLSNLNKPVYSAEGLSFLPPFLSPEFTARRSSTKEGLTEILVAELGDSTHKSPYMILRSANDDLIIYQPYQSPIEGSKDTSLRFLKIPNPHLPSIPNEDDADVEKEQQGRLQHLRSLHDVGGYSAVFMLGQSPCFIIKSASSPPQVIDMCGGSVKSLTELHSPTCHKGFLYIDGEGTTRTAQLPLQSQYETGWVTRRIPLGEEVHALTYHEEMDAYVLGTSTVVDFKLPDDEFHSHWTAEETTFLPQAEQGSIKLLDHKSLSIIDKYTLSPSEVVTCIQTLSLEVSEHTHQRQNLVCIGTALLRGPDLPSLGHIYIFAVIAVVPEPDRPETGRALKLVAREEVKGAVTSLSGIGTQGFLLVAQGQKCMVRGLKEDGSLLPVAFLDMQCHVSVVRELPGTGLCLMGDAVKGVWFCGYTEEPYQLRLFGKSPRAIEVVTASFLPSDKQLYMAVADAECNIHILQFDPE
ncbi:MAG: mRNA cleavage and polyadenylation factor subunit, partial [Alectoria fallacina]